MKNKRSSQDSRSGIDAAKFVKNYEAAVANSEVNKKRRMERRLAEEVVWESPASVVELYESLSVSVAVDARLLAVDGIAAAVLMGAEGMGSVWNRLLNDESREVAKEAYKEFDALCFATEASEDRVLDLSHVYEQPPATDAKV